MENLLKFERVMAFRKSLTPETDRGCALMAAAYLDSQLYDLLKASFVDDAISAEELLGQSKPLGTFSSRIDLGFALGLFGPSTKRELHIIRKIRNLFGHDFEPISFEKPEIADRCRELHGYQYLKGTTPRAAFIRSVMGILARIHGELNLTSHRPVGKDTTAVSEEDKKEFEDISINLKKLLGLAEE